MEVKVEKIDNLTDYDKPLKVKFEAKGTVGTPTGKRLVLPVDLFTTSERATFTQEKRDLAVYFHYPETVVDAVRINLPATMSVEAVPPVSKLSIPNTALYSLEATPAANSVTVRRTFSFRRDHCDAEGLSATADVLLAVSGEGPGEHRAEDRSRDSVCYGRKLRRRQSREQTLTTAFE